MMKKKGMKKGGKMNVVKAGKGPMKRKLTKAEEAEDIRNRLRGTTGGGKSVAGPAMKKGGMMKKKGMAKGGAMKKKAYAKGGKVAMYNQGGMVKSTGTMNTGVKTAKNTYK